MADNSGKIKYSDLFSSDVTTGIEYLTIQLDDMNKQFGVMTNAIRANAIKIVSALKQVSSATTEGKQVIDENAIAASRLERAQKELAFAMTDTGKQVAWLKERTKEFNASSVNQKKIITALNGSYDKLKAELKDNVNLWKSLSAEERNDVAIGGEVLNKILNIKFRLAELNNELKTQVTRITELEKAQQRLNFLRSEEGQRLIAVKKEIQAVLAGKKEEKITVDQLTVSQEKLKYALSEENVQLNQINAEIRQANKIASLTARINMSTEGSYNRLAAQYELNKIKLNAMSQAERFATNEGKALEAETLALYKRMIHLQEATGNHRLSVGNYARTWNGLGNAMNQVVREIPSMAVSLNTFFLAISNNIPILIDEIQRVRDKNKQLRADGKPTKNIIGTIISSLLSWQTALILLITALSYNGKAILEWIGRATGLYDSAKSNAQIISSLNEEIVKNNGNYGDSMVTLAKLQREYKSLGDSIKEKTQFIKDHKSEFDKLDVSIRNVADAENLLIDNTDAFKRAMMQRARSAAAASLASQEFEKAIQAQVEAESKTEKDDKGKPTGNFLVSFWNKLNAFVASGGSYEESYETRKSLQDQGKLEQAYAKREQQRLKKEQHDREKNANKYIEIVEKSEEEIDKIYEKYGFKRAHKYAKNRQRREKDLTDKIWKNDLTIRKKYEASITELLRDEFRKRKQESVDSAEATIRELKEKFRQNEVILAGKKGTKPLTEEQKQQIEEQQRMLLATIKNTNKQLQDTLADINAEEVIDSMQSTRQIMDFRYDSLSEELEKEKQLKLQQVEDKYSRLIIPPTTVESIANEQTGANNLGVTVTAKKPTKEQYAKYSAERLKIEAEYDEKILNLRQKFVDNRLEIVEKGSFKELQLQLQQNEISRQKEIAQNNQKKIEERQSEEDIDAKYYKRAKLLYGKYNIDRQQQINEFNKSELEAKKSSNARIEYEDIKGQIELWQLKIALAKQGALEMSEIEIDIAENTIKKLQDQLKKLKSTGGKGDGIIGRIGQYGVLGALFSYIPKADDEAIKGFNDACNNIISNLQEIAQAEIDVAQAAVDAAQKRVDAAQSVYEGEMEARANGYANNVATAKKELQEEKKKQREKEKLLAAAQRRQEAIDTVIQTSSLITASANIWKSLSGIPIIGPALAIAMIATMFTSFAAAKIKARQATNAANSEYGEGGLEFLEGGSHASGNDINLHTKNKEGKNMKAEGGEALAIINKRNTRKYKKVLPEVIKSLNSGVFEDKFSTAFSTSDAIQHNIIQVSNNADLTRIEKSLTEIKNQGKQQIYALNDGRVLIIKGNIKTIINN